METDAPRYARRMTSGAEPGAVKAASPVLNGEDEETGRKALRLVLTQRRGAGDQTGYLWIKRATIRSLREGGCFKGPPEGRLCACCGIPTASSVCPLSTEAVPY